MCTHTHTHTLHVLKLSVHTFKPKLYSLMHENESLTTVKDSSLHRVTLLQISSA